MNITQAVKNTLLRWKLWGALAITVLATSYYLGEYSVAYDIKRSLSEALSYPGYVLFWLSILSFTYAWLSGRIKFLTIKRVIISVPLLIVVYLDASYYLYEEFIAFQVLPTPFVTGMDFSLFVFSINAAIPFELLLKESGLWDGGGLIAITGPNHLGFYLVAIIYSFFIYITWSGFAFLLGKSRSSSLL